MHTGTPTLKPVESNRKTSDDEVKPTKLHKLNKDMGQTDVGPVIEALLYQSGLLGRPVFEARTPDQRFEIHVNSEGPLSQMCLDLYRTPKPTGGELWPPHWCTGAESVC